MTYLSNIIFQKVHFNKNLIIKNRVVLPPMCTYKAANDGIPNSFHHIHYGARALGGVGLIIVEATAVESRGRISGNDIGLWNDIQIQGHQLIAATCHSFDSKVFVQIAHAGRKGAASDESIIAPSTIPFSDSYEIPTEIDLTEIKKVRKAFVQAAIRAERSGYDGVELHAAHGYLLHSFLSPITNYRNDSYGGSFENRTRIIKEIISEIKENTDIPIGIRISATDWMRKGWNIDDSIRLIQELEKDLVYVHVSAGGIHPIPDNIPDIKPLYQINYANSIKQKVSIPVIGVGLITQVEEISTILENNACDMVALGRELLRNPNFMQYAAQKIKAAQEINSSYYRAFPLN